MYRAAALADLTGNLMPFVGLDIEFSLYTLEWPGLAIGESTGVCICRCCVGTSGWSGRRSSCGDGVALDNGLLLCIEERDPEGVV